LAGWLAKCPATPPAANSPGLGRATVGEPLPLQVWRRAADTVPHYFGIYGKRHQGPKAVLSEPPNASGLFKLTRRKSMEFLMMETGKEMSQQAVGVSSP